MEDENQILQRIEALNHKFDGFDRRLRAMERRVLEIEHENANNAGTAPTLLKSIRELQGVIGDQTPSVKALLATFHNDVRTVSSKENKPTQNK
jgi:predicted  nucleic acid-binding Zn-ribbon protein